MQRDIEPKARSLRGILFDLHLHPRKESKRKVCEIKKMLDVPASASSVPYTKVRAGSM